MIRKIYERIPRFIRNKYFLVITVFVIWMLFLDRNNFMSQLGLRNDLKKLEKERAFYLEETRKDSIDLYRLVNDSLEAERIGREKYVMKKDSEDVFIIVRKPGTKK
jgi:hypothetical protein